MAAYPGGRGQIRAYRPSLLPDTEPDA